MKQLLEKKVSLLLTVILLIVFAGGAWGITYLCMKPVDDTTGAEQTTQQLFDTAVKDAMTVESDEIQPVVSLESGAPYATYDDQGRTLLLTFHKYPDSYPDGADVSIAWGDVWTFTGAELEAWYKDNGSDVEDWSTRFRQLLGLTPDNGATHFTAMWVDPDDVMRPAYVSDIGSVQMTDALAEDTDETFKSWFDDNIVWSYFDSAYPWTRLGYTYDWADNGTEYGLSEFVVNNNSSVNVAYTVTTDEFLTRLQDGSWLPETQTADNAA